MVEDEPGDEPVQAHGAPRNEVAGIDDRTSVSGGRLLERNRELAAVSVAIRSLSRSPDLAQVLQNITDAARNLIGSRYAALGVADAAGRIRQFITSGVTPAQRRAIGPLPRGHGLLGALIREAEPIRIPQIAADARSSGFPPHHPPMTSLLGVPIVFGERVLGDLYLTDKLDAPEFNADDEDLLVLLAEHAAAAIEHARLYGEVGAARDLLHVQNAQLERQYREVEAASRMKSAFLANMSHELRTPLNAVIGFSQLLHDGEAGPVAELQREYLHDILTSADHLLEMIDGILDLTHLISGDTEFERAEVDLEKCAREVAQTLQPEADAKQLTIRTEIDRSLGTIESDPIRVRQIFASFLSNAVKFTPSGGRVTIRATSDRDADFRIEVEDTGIGIPLDEQDRLFTDFGQLDTGMSKQYQGAGLGLALTKRLVEAMGGRVGMRSRVPNGSIFYAILPRSRHGDTPYLARGGRTS